MIKIGDEVGWVWASGIATGTVKEISHERTQINTKGKLITRNGSKEDPAITILNNKGVLILKLAHELQVIRDPVSSE